MLAGHFDYSRARDVMIAATDTGSTPWYVVDNNDKKRGRLNIISPAEPDPVRAPRGARRDDAEEAEPAALLGARSAGCTTFRSPSKQFTARNARTDDMLWSRC